ncbi:LacI family DNA-binding transcriptional regulator [Neobacillus drentensis]|uniref:LacI family DNA-binding transcriptional regulator n=1 Tax=Neobacillus drentensis TaxID=220684 RepID=UPI000825F504|nr:LacI family DNA-binding transcriptional regulator [Neobacillus drentensis]
MTVTIKDIAKQAGVSITTVSRIINNKAEGIRKETCEKVLKVVEELHYKPNSIARSMITKKTYTIGLVIPDIRNPFFPELVRGVEDVANAAQYTVFLCNTDSSHRKETDYLAIMKEKNVDGIIFTGPQELQSKDFYQSVQEYEIPIILLDRGQEIEDFSGVYIDNVQAGYMATKHLLELSHQNIGCITGPAAIPNSNERYKGYLKAFSEFQIPVDESIVIPGNYQMEGGYVAAKALLKERDVTAIFAFNDLMAFGVYQAAYELGIKIPEDLSVVGFDNLPFNQLIRPKLTTIEQSAYKMGEIAAKMLFDQINNEKSVKEQVFIEPTLIINGSTKEHA